MGEATPIVQCPGPVNMGCGTILYVSDPACYGCGRLFEGGELWSIYEARIGR